MDTVTAPPAPATSCPPPPPGGYTEGPIACTDAAGNVGCRYAAPFGDPLDFRATPCLSGCVPGTVASCKTTCQTAGTEICGADGAWSACTAFETCDGIDNDCDGNVDVANGVSVCQTALSAWDPQHGPGWDTWLDGCASTDTGAPITQWSWEVDLPGGPRTFGATMCKAPFTFPAEGAYIVKLKVGDASGHVSDTKTRTVTIKNIVIASIGDSVGSGEGNPDTPISSMQPTPIWEDRRCHRSMDAAHALTASWVEQADPHTSVTFSFFSCSGAGIVDGLIDPYAGEEVLPSDTPALLHPQLSELHRVMPNASRSIDVLLLQIGANDVGFGDVVRECAYPVVPVPGMGDVLSCANDDNAKRIAARIVDLENTRYPELKTTLDASVPIDHGKVYVSAYHDPTHADDGSLCNEIRFPGAVTDAFVSLAPDPSAGFLSTLAQVYIASKGGAFATFVDSVLMGADLDDGVISSDEVKWAYGNVIVPMNAAIGRAVAANGWTFVTGLPDAFSKHGYCAGAPWVRHYEESKALQGNNQGTVHPNVNGHKELADLLFAAVSKDLVASGVFPAPTSDGGASADAADAQAPLDGSAADAPPEAPPPDASVVDMPVGDALDASSNPSDAPTGDASTSDGDNADAGVSQ
jgi:PKD repeat protein